MGHREDGSRRRDVRRRLAAPVRPRARAPRRRRRARRQPRALDRRPRRRRALPAADRLPRQDGGARDSAARPVHRRHGHARRAPRRVRPRGDQAGAPGRPPERAARDVRRGDAAEVRRARRGEAGRGHGRDPGGRARAPGRDLQQHSWKLGSRAPISLAWGEPMRFAEHPRNSKGYKAATAEIETEIRRLWEFLAEMHRLGRPQGTPPRRASVPSKSE